MRAFRAAASVVASLALLVGVPWLLSRTIGNPLTRLPDLLAGDVNDHVVLAALAAALYVAWAQFAVAFAVELISAVRRTPMPQRIPGVFAGQQGLARALVSGPFRRSLKVSVELGCRVEQANWRIDCDITLELNRWRPAFASPRTTPPAT